MHTRMTCRSTITQLHQAWPACCNEWPSVSRMSPPGCPRIDSASIPQRLNSSGWDHLDGFRTVPRTPKWAFWDLSFVRSTRSEISVCSSTAAWPCLIMSTKSPRCVTSIFDNFASCDEHRRMRLHTPWYELSHSLVRAFIHNRIDYCNGILASSPKYLTEKLQSVLRVAARLVLRLPSRSPVSTLMHDQLHWLSVESRVKFKLALRAYKSVHGLAPEYLSAFCVPVSRMPGRSHLRSAGQWTMLVPRTKTMTIGPRGFLLFVP